MEPPGRQRTGGTPLNPPQNAVQRALDCWGAVLPGEPRGQRKSSRSRKSTLSAEEQDNLPSQSRHAPSPHTSISSNTNNHTVTINTSQDSVPTSAQQPTRLFYNQPALPRRTLILQPTSSRTARSSSQTRITAFQQATNPLCSRLYGEDMGPKSDDSYRIDSHNIDCLGLEAIGNQKQNTLKDWIAKKDIDIIGMQEIGISNHMLPKHERIAERIRDYRRSQIRVVAANNKNENIDKFQWGGTTTIAYDMLANMTRASGVDETGLGRWSCVQLEGYENKRVRVLSAYNPCRTHTHQFATVYSQQKRYFLSKKIDICP